MPHAALSDGNQAGVGDLVRLNMSNLVEFHDSLRRRWTATPPMQHVEWLDRTFWLADTNG
jgi:hypothetical protein